MSKKSLIVLSFLLAAAGAHAQPSPAKKELVARIVKHQQAGIEGMARNLVEQPVAELLVNAGNALQVRVPADKQQAVGKEIQADVRNYVNEAVPIVQARAVAIAPATLGGLLEERFTEDELKQVVAIMESPVYAKFQKLGDDMQRALAEKVVAETRSTIEPKLRALEQAVARRLGVSGPPAAAQGTPKAAAPAPARPAAPKASAGK